MGIVIGGAAESGAAGESERCSFTMYLLSPRFSNTAVHAPAIVCG
jgi:hypothetical protein